MKEVYLLFSAVRILVVLVLLGATGHSQEIDRRVYEPVLLPLWTNGIEGAYNTTWLTTLAVGNPHASPVLGFANLQCPFVCGTDFLVAARDVTPMRLLSPLSHPPASVIWVQRTPPQPLHYTLLLRLGSAEESSMVATIPAVRESELLDRTFFIPAVPVEPNVRYRLRVYDLSGQPAAAMIHVHGDFIGQLLSEQTTALLESPNEFSPSYIEIALDGLPFGPFRTFSIEVTPTAPNRAQMWALLTATHNDTQNVVIFVP